MKVIAGSSNPTLAKEIADGLQLELIQTEINTFANGEKRVWIKDTIRGENVILVQTFSQPADEHIMEFLLLVDALQRLGARHVNAVIPWLGYSLQDKVFREGEPIASKVVADLISHAYVKRAFLMDLHNSSTPGFFSIPTHHLSAMPLFIEYVRQNFDVSQSVVASPDFGGIKRARTFASKLEVELVNIDKHRDLTTGETTAMGLHGNVQGKNVFILDDVINTGSTVVTAGSFLKSQGAKSVHFMSTHGIFADNGQDRVDTSEVDSVIVTNSIPQDVPSKKIKTISCAPLFCEALATWA
jgi:ribose-phosphate pyrophosphokinase